MTTPEELDRLAHKHLWTHFSAPAKRAPEVMPVLVRGEGCHVLDSTGRRLFDGLSGLFAVQLGHGRRDLAEAAAAQARTLAYTPLWSTGHPPAIELAARIAAVTPGDLDRVFFTSGGSESVESAWKLARQWARLRGEPLRHKVIARRTAYHGTTFGALSITGIPAMKAAFEPLVPGVAHVVNTNRYRHPLGADEKAFARWAADEIDLAIRAEGPETVAAVFLEPLQNGGGCFPPPAGYFERVREICDAHGVLLVADEVICGFGRLGEWFGAQRYDFLPDVMTCAKGITSGYAPLGAVIAREHVAEAFLEADASFLHGLTFAGHPVSCAVANVNIDAIRDEGVIDHVREMTPGLGDRMRSLYDVPIVGDVRGDGYFWAVEMVRDQQTAERFDRAEVAELCTSVKAGMRERGLIARADDRGDPVVQVCPPLIAGDAELDEMVDALRGALTDAATRF